MTPLDHRSLAYDSSAITHPGRVRPLNEDSIFSSAERGIWLVADGMGGHRDGNVASAMIAEVVGALDRRESLSDLTEAFRDGIDRVNAALLAISNGESQLLVGSTVVALLIRGREYRCLWAGDSRCYLIRDNRLQMLSHDHTEVQELVDRGVITPGEAATWPRRNVITRAVGADADFELSETSGRLHAGDRFVLCSDGLTGHVSDEEILERARTARARDASAVLLDLALARGGKDNISVVLVNVFDRDPTMVQGR